MAKNDNFKTENFIEGFTDKEGVRIEDFDFIEMTGETEEAIAKPEIKRNGGKVVRTVLEHCLVRLGQYIKSDMKINDWRELIKQMPVAEQDYALLKIRDDSIGGDIEIDHECPHCKKKLHSIVGTDELEIMPFNGITEIPFELPKGVKDKEGNILKVGIMRRPTGEDRELLDPIARKNFGMANTLLLSKCVLELEGNKVTDKIIRSMAVKDREYLLMTLKENLYGINVENIEFTCSSCGETFEQALNSINFI